MYLSYRDLATARNFVNLAGNAAMRRLIRHVASGKGPAATDQPDDSPPPDSDTRGMIPNELRMILADACDGAAERLRAGIGPGAEPEPMPERQVIWDPLPDVADNVLNVEDVARLLGISRWRAYESRPPVCHERREEREVMT